LIADLSNGALATVRVITCRNERGEIEVTNAVLRMARGNNTVVDNFHAGGIAAKVNLQSGVLGRATDLGVRTTTAWCETHPDTGARILGRTLPFWSDTLDLVRRAHAVFSDRMFIGWDVAVLQDGPQLIEGNGAPDLDIIQRTHQEPVGNAQLGQILAGPVLGDTSRPVVRLPPHHQPAVGALLGVAVVRVEMLVLEACPDSLAVSRLPRLAWTDLGSPRRVIEVMDRLGIRPPWADRLTGGLSERVLGRHVPGLGLVATALFVLIVGTVATNVIGRRLLERAEQILLHVPLFRTVYAPVKQLISAFSPDNEFGFKRMVLVDNGSRGFALGFLTKEFSVDRGQGPEALVAVYMPTNHLYLGDVVVCRLDQLSFPDMTVEEGVRVFLTGGMGMPDAVRTGDGSHERPGAG
jgi:uncharacterized membrane protein